MIKFNTEKIRKFIDEKNNELLDTYKPIKGAVFNKPRKLMYSNSSFAYDNDIPIVSFYDIMKGKTNPTLTNAYKIAKGMGCKIEDLIVYSRFGD